jgi:hypothetical protein
MPTLWHSTPKAPLIRPVIVILGFVTNRISVLAGHGHACALEIADFMWRSAAQAN